MQNRGLVAVGVVTIGLLFPLGACGGDTESEQAGDPETVTVERTVEEQAPPAEAAEEEPSGGGDGGDIAVPDVVGEDHQLAQDTMQAEGLYNLDERDATGQGRLLIIDRNWTVVKQDPPAGTKVGPDERITLYSKKDNE